MKYLFVCLLLSCISLGVLAKDPAREKQDVLITKLLNQQVRQHISIQNSVSSILKRYPEKVDAVLNAALATYPDDYRQIMLGAISAEPALACDVVEKVIKANVATNEEIVSIAIKAEPAYAREIVDIAAKQNPAKIAEIVRIAIITEPFVGQSVMDNSMLTYPDKMLDILTAAITAIPEQAVSLVKSTLALFPGEGEKVITTAISSSHSHHSQEIVDAGVDSGISEDSAIAAAIAGGADKQVFAQR